MSVASSSVYVYCSYMTKVEEISAALFLEQAAIANLELRPRPARRKAAFHFCMAGQRYEKTGMVSCHLRIGDQYLISRQKLLARRCLLHASGIYGPNAPDVDGLQPTNTPSASWRLIQDHIYEGLGRQASNLGRSAEAIGYYLKLLSRTSDHHLETGEDDSGIFIDLDLAAQVSSSHTMLVALTYENSNWAPMRPKLFQTLRQKALCTYLISKVPDFRRVYQRARLRTSIGRL